MRDAEKRLFVQVECRARCVHMDASPPHLKASHGRLWQKWNEFWHCTLRLFGINIQTHFYFVTMRVYLSRQKDKLVSLIYKLFNIKACDMALHTCFGVPQTSQVFQEGAQWGVCVQSAKLSHKCAPAPFPTHALLWHLTFSQPLRLVPLLLGISLTLSASSITGGVS